MRTFAAATLAFLVAMPFATASELGAILAEDVCRSDKQQALTDSQLADLMNGVQVGERTLGTITYYYSRANSPDVTMGGQCDQSRRMNVDQSQCKSASVTLNGHTLILGVWGPAQPC